MDVMIMSLVKKFKINDLPLEHANISYQLKMFNVFVKFLNVFVTTLASNKNSKKN